MPRAFLFKNAHTILAKNVDKYVLFPGNGLWRRWVKLDIFVEVDHQGVIDNNRIQYLDKSFAHMLLSEVYSLCILTELFYNLNKFFLLEKSLNILVPGYSSMLIQN